LFRIRTQDQNIIPTQEPRPNGVLQTQYMDRRCPLYPGRKLGSEAHLRGVEGRRARQSIAIDQNGTRLGRKLGSEAHLYLSCPVTSSLADPLIAELRTRFPWDGYTQHQQMAVLLGTIPQEPFVQHHKQWFRTMLPRCHALAVQLTLTVQKELQMSAAKAGMTAGQLRAAFSAPQATAGGVPCRLRPLWP
jgi:hypothetical protein